MDAPGEQDRENANDHDTDTVVLYVLSVGYKLCYTIPSFPVFSTVVRRIKFQVCELDGEVKVVD